MTRAALPVLAALLRLLIVANGDLEISAPPIDAKETSATFIEGPNVEDAHRIESRTGALPRRFSNNASR